MALVAACGARRGGPLALGLPGASRPSELGRAAGWHSGPGQGGGGAAGRGPSPRGLYELLGVSPSATQAQIKAAYYKQSFLCHPDRNAGSESAAERFTRVHEAYRVLGSVGLRRKYDRGLLSRQDLHAARPPSPRGDPEEATGGAAAEQQQQRRHWRASPTRPARPAAAPAPPPGGKPIFNFDQFYRAHYGEQLEREQQVRAQLREKKRREEEQGLGRLESGGDLLVLLVAVGGLLAIFIFR